MRLITNHDDSNHLTTLISLIEDADEIYLATAFLKESGLNRLFGVLKQIVKGQKCVQIVVGQNFALTEPNALYALRELFMGSDGCQVYLAHAINPKEVFHPKLSLIRRGSVGYILSGSSNITQAGLTSNFEASILIECNIGNKTWQSAIDHFALLTSTRVSLPATLFTIRKYENYFNAVIDHNSKSRPTPDKTVIEREFDYDRLLLHFHSFNNERRPQQFKERQDEYRRAMEILDEIADDDNLTKEKFAILLDQLVGTKSIDNLWHSGSLFRLRKYVYPHYKNFRRLVLFIRNNQGKSISEIFDGAKRIVRDIQGASANYVAEIMMTYNQRDCANLNRNPITVLKQVAGIKLKAHSSSFDGKDYEEYSTIIKDICELLTLRNMLEADTFFNEIYWKIYKSEAGD